MSSDICSKRVNWAHVGVAFACAPCAPKNIGHAGLTVVVVRRSLVEGGETSPVCPGEAPAPTPDPPPHP